MGLSQGIAKDYAAQKSKSPFGSYSNALNTFQDNRHLPHESGLESGIILETSITVSGDPKIINGLQSLSGPQIATVPRQSKWYQITESGLRPIYGKNPVYGNFGNLQQRRPLQLSHHDLYKYGQGINDNQNYSYALLYFFNDHKTFWLYV